MHRILRATVLVLLCVLVVDITGIRAQENIDFPDLTGDYQVGRAVYHFVDDDPEGIFSTDPIIPVDLRDLTVTVYYPAEISPDARPAPYVPERIELLGEPVVDYERVSIHAYADVPVSSDQTSHPLLLFYPGGYMDSFLYAALLEEVASHGYVVACISPWYIDGVDWGELGDVWVLGMIFTANQLVALNRDDPLLAGSVDMTRVGAFGHSFGGAVAAEAAHRDQRFLAALNMDGGLFGDVVESGIDRPFMMMLSDRSWQTDRQLDDLGITRDGFEERGSRKDAQGRVLVESAPAGYLVTPQGFGHLSFSDFLLLVVLLANPRRIDCEGKGYTLGQ